MGSVFEVAFPWGAFGFCCFVGGWLLVFSVLIVTE